MGLDGVDPGGAGTYSIVVAPELWLLGHRIDHRVFRDMSIPDIAKKLLGEWGITPTMKLLGAFPKLPQRAQYGESDYDFLRRLLVEAGIAFHFDPRAEKSPLVLTDAPDAAEARTTVPYVDDGGMGGFESRFWNVLESDLPPKRPSRRRGHRGRLRFSEARLSRQRIAEGRADGARAPRTVRVSAGAESRRRRGRW